MDPRGYRHYPPSSTRQSRRRSTHPANSDHFTIPLQDHQTPMHPATYPPAGQVYPNTPGRSHTMPQAYVSSVVWAAAHSVHSNTSYAAHGIATNIPAYALPHGVFLPASHASQYNSWPVADGERRHHPLALAWYMPANNVRVDENHHTEAAPPSIHVTRPPTSGVVLRGADRSPITYIPELQTQVSRERRILDYDHASAGQGRPECGICLKQPSEGNDSVKIEGCSHEFCRECLRLHVKSKVEDKVYPIMCPQCAVSDVHSGHSGVLDNSFIRTLGIHAETFDDFETLELSILAVEVRCPTCARSFNGWRNDIDTTNIAHCPLSPCIGVWCTNCNKPVHNNGRSHVCDDMHKFNGLMNAERWRYCPGCHTPTSKSGGCNHMRCLVPACNMHFCYTCGKAIIRSLVANEVHKALQIHNRACRSED